LVVGLMELLVVEALTPLLYMMTLIHLINSGFLSTKVVVM
jgi:hypothetical protein